jgi:hypothetical protein
MAMVQSLSRVVPSLQERWMPPVISAHAAGMERFDARSVLRTGFISTLQIGEIASYVLPHILLLFNEFAQAV